MYFFLDRFATCFKTWKFRQWLSWWYRLFVTELFQIVKRLPRDIFPFYIVDDNYRRNGHEKNHMTVGRFKRFVNFVTTLLLLVFSRLKLVNTLRHEPTSVLFRFYYRNYYRKYSQFMKLLRGPTTLRFYPSAEPGETVRRSNAGNKTYYGVSLRNQSNSTLETICFIYICTRLCKTGKRNEKWSSGNKARRRNIDILLLWAPWNDFEDQKTIRTKRFEYILR